MPFPFPALRRLRAAAPLAALLASGCHAVLLDPAGEVARRQAVMIYWSVGLMLLIILPVMALTVLFAWRYRAANREVTYAPDWDHSTGLELVIWAAPLLIIIALGALTWTGTHLLDPYRPLDRTDGKTGVAAAAPLEVDVVSLDWKWLFIYPEQGIATVNRLVVPTDRPVHFRMTSSSVMNTLWVPAMAGMIYTMPGMETQLHASLDRVGDYDGRSGNYSGAGFSDMTFRTFALPQAQFDRWVSTMRASPLKLDAATYLRLERPTERVRPFAFGAIDRGLYARVVAMCVKPGTTCMSMVAANQPKAPEAGAPPVNNRPMLPAEPNGALMREPADKKAGEGRFAPRKPPAGQTKPGAPANRTFTLLDRPASAGASA